jgi:hypothetical protein
MWHGTELAKFPNATKFKVQFCTLTKHSDPNLLFDIMCDVSHGAATPTVSQYCTNYDVDCVQPPSLINALIDIALNIGNVAEPMYNSQVARMGMREREREREGETAAVGTKRVNNASF